MIRRECPHFEWKPWLGSILLGAGALYFVMRYVTTLMAEQYERGWQRRRQAPR